MPIGLDIGTYNIIKTIRDDKKNIESTRQINAFFTIPIEHNFILGMMRETGVPVVERGNTAYVLGEAATEIALTMGKEFRRPMEAGVLSIKEREAFDILAVIVKSMIGKISANKEALVYSVPADAINATTNAEYHQRVVQSILASYKSEGKTVEAFPINEAYAIIIAELADKKRTGIGISFGAGLVNVCAAIYSIPVFQFSIAGSGDKIDELAANASGETKTFINKAKQKIDLSKEPACAVERAIVFNYRILVEDTLKEIVKGIKAAGSKAKTDNPVDIVIAGGASAPKGFIEFFKKVFSEVEFPIEVGDIRIAKNPLYSVSVGCLMAAEAREKQNGDNVDALYEENRKEDKKK